MQVRQTDRVVLVEYCDQAREALVLPLLPGPLEIPELFAVGRIARLPA